MQSARRIRKLLRLLMTVRVQKIFPVPVQADAERKPARLLVIPLLDNGGMVRGAILARKNRRRNRVLAILVIQARKHAVPYAKMVLG